MTTIGVILNGCESAAVASAASLAVSTATAVLGLADLGLADFQTPVAADIRRILQSNIDTVVVDSLRDLPQGYKDVSALAWEDYQALRKAGRETMANPELIRDVLLRDYSVAVVYEAEINVFVDPLPHPVAVIKVDMRVALKIAEFTGVVQRGRLMSVRGTFNAIEASLSIRGGTVVSRRVEPRLATEIPLGDGIPCC